MQQQNNQKSQQIFSELLYDNGYSEKVAGAIWRWYNPSKKGVESF